ncbi:hypothetical protein P152DRAFT_32737 [Eremomyces bilateralis CBS 781.70]|uniref:Zn(2)-C6 fungal-type domain-containing protein n=1 Tax=Eremomyces bilateralis CBS 781.70 TaxID=1392243 RepID=A0A6G1G333_9PEZI|nr:uncharacterized protein P152DRAFT_32737 [Eremomyces bilateralis CBS 781.70]KAF1812326.1 hypothetical protein P152DRAFT_32737 [Eremomyces bilateralis CBS 781.70]
MSRFDQEEMDDPNFWLVSGDIPSRTVSPGSGSSLDHAKPRRRPIPRKGHTKSRKGCYSCKKRKIKCQEGVPECYHCAKAGLVCVYPVTEKTLALAVPRPGLQSTPTTFTMQDLRYFHHFLVGAYPHLPVKGDDIWKNRVAQISHSYDFLMHSMLALAASHLSLFGDEDRGSAALSHRVAAINSLNASLSQPCQDGAESDARFATIMALTFQSRYIPDGMKDFLTMIRGCTVVAQTAMLPFEESSFGSFTHEGHVSTIASLIQMDIVVSLDGDGWKNAIDSLRDLRPLVQTPFEQQYLAALENALQLAKTAPIDAYTTFTMLYVSPADISHEEFLRFLEPQNTTGQLLLAHFFALEILLGPILWFELQHRNEMLSVLRQISFHWVEKMCVGLPESHQSFARWPLEYSIMWRRSLVSNKSSFIEVVDS